MHRSNLFTSCSCFVPKPQNSCERGFRPHFEVAALGCSPISVLVSLCKEIVLLLQLTMSEPSSGDSVLASMQEPTSGLSGHEPAVNDQHSDEQVALGAAESVERMQKELSVHNSALRAILTHICQRLARLEKNQREVQSDISQLRGDTHRTSEDVRGEVSGVNDKVNMITSQLNEYASVMDLFQSEMRSQQTNLSWLSTAVNDGKEHIKGVDDKVEHQRDDFNNRFSEIAQKLQELPAALAALQPGIQPPPQDLFTFRQAEDNKLSLQTHIQRLEDAQRPGQGPFTDLEPFTIPDDMRVKVERRIRQQEASKREADAAAAAELSDAYRRLQLAAANSNNPRISELRLNLDQCQQELKRAFQLIRTSNLQLYSCCESKAERMEIAALQSELKHLRSRLREIERSPPNAAHRASKHSLLPHGDGLDGNQLALSLQVGDAAKTSAKSSRSTHQLTHAQIPELRVSLLELSRNLNLLKHQWKKQKRVSGGGSTGNANPVAQKHLEKLVAMINDAYAAMAQEPVELAVAAAHVEKVGRVLGSDFSMQILALLGGRSDEPESCRFPAGLTARAASGEMASALCKYAEAFTDMFFRHEADNKVATAAMTEWALEKRTLENVGREVDALSRNQHVLEATLSKLTAALNKKAGLDVPMLVGIEESGTTTGEGEDSRLPPWSRVGDELQALKDQMAFMSKQFVTESTLTDALRQLTLGDGIVGQRYVPGSGASTPPGTRMPLGSPSSASLLRRSTTSAAETNSSPMKMLAALTLDDSDSRLKSQTKLLNPLQVVKISGEPRPVRNSMPHGRTGASATSATSTLGKIHARAQMLRPKSTQRDRDNYP